MCGMKRRKAAAVGDIGQARSRAVRERRGSSGVGEIKGLMARASEG